MTTPGWSVATGFGACLLLAVATGRAEEGPVRTPPDLAQDVPANFARFHAKGHEASIQLLNNYLWHHFKSRTGDPQALFYQEYLTCADMWLGGALRPGCSTPIQDVHRNNLLRVQISPDGYVNTQQHFSHAHEQGWPFPLWTQVPGGPAGTTAGWHFQEDGPGWVWDLFLGKWGDVPWGGKGATNGWQLTELKSLGISNGVWKVQSTGPSPMLTTPAAYPIDAFNAPYLQLRMSRTGKPDPKSPPYVEWMRESDEAFSSARRVAFDLDAGNPEYESVSKTEHYVAALHTHPRWKGRIKRMRIALSPGESNVSFGVDSFFTAYDTRHAINNPIYIFASWNYFRWTGDLDFLRAQIGKMRTALRYQQTVMGGLEHNHIRNEWPGHDGLPAFTLKADGTKAYRAGHGIGNNYWDLLPFGWDDFYSTSQYFASLQVMADIEEAIAGNPGWKVPGTATAFDPATLRAHATAVRQMANRKFWNQATGRFIGCIDKEGVARDYGFTFVNLESIWYGIASQENARSLMDWIDGTRKIPGDTSTGADIYHWRFGPRATTKRNVEWYVWAWLYPESIPWGGQLQDGGSALGFSFYDLWARLKLRGPDDAWQRLTEIMAWEKDVRHAGGYRKYYAGGKHGTTLQGGGTAGGLGIDVEFLESSLLPAIMVYGFLGIDPRSDGLAIDPRLPTNCPELGAVNLLCRGVRFDIKVDDREIVLYTKTAAVEPFAVVAGNAITISAPGVYRLRRR